jgi:ligand-binding sensor domain-containing protein/ribosomal protein L40E
MEPERDPEAPEDKAAATVVTCEACSAENDADAETCRSCGRELGTDDDEDDDEAAEGEGGGLAEWRGLLLIGGVFAAVVLAWFLLAPSKPGTAPGAATSTAPNDAAAVPKPENEVKEIELAGDMVWVGTSRGVFGHDRKTGEQKQLLNATTGLLHEFVDSILADRDGKLWIGGFGGGVSVYDGANWTHHEPATTGNKTVIAAVQDRAGKYWFATSGAGLYAFDGAKWTNYTRKNGLPDDEVNAIAQDADGSVWAGTSLGAAHFKDGKWKTYRTTDGLANDKVLAIAVDAQGAKWFGTFGGGLSRFDGTAWRTYGALPDGPRSAFVLSARADSSGKLWFGTHDGVSMYDGAAWTHFAPGDGLLGQDVYAIEIDADGQKWFGTYRGVSRLDAANKEWKQFPH